jgi:hypothetical protein
MGELDGVDTEEDRGESVDEETDTPRLWMIWVAFVAKYKIAWTSRPGA